MPIPVTVKIAVVSDTHCHTWEEVHPDIRRAVSEADVAVHCGDFTHMDVVEGVRRSAKRAVIVHGNSDPVEVREALPYVELLEVEGRRIGVTHPAWGGPPFDPKELLGDFPDGVDAVLFGHLHETVSETQNGVLFLSPGQGYVSFMVPATMAMLTIENGVMSTEIRVVADAR